MGYGVDSIASMCLVGHGTPRPAKGSQATLGVWSVTGALGMFLPPSATPVSPSLKRLKGLMGYGDTMAGKEFLVCDRELGSMKDALMSLSTRYLPLLWGWKSFISLSYEYETVISCQRQWTVQSPQFLKRPLLGRIVANWQNFFLDFSRKGFIDNWLCENKIFLWYANAWSPRTFIWASPG